MNGDLLVVIFIAVTIAVLVFSKTHIAFIILALCTGYVLREFAADEMLSLLETGVSATEFPLFEIVHVSLTLIPALLVAYRFRGTQKGAGRFFEQLVPALSLTLLALVFLVDVLPDDVSNTVKDNAYLAGLFDRFSWVIIVFAIATSLFDLMIKHAGDGFSSKKRRGPGRPPK